MQKINQHFYFTDDKKMQNDCSGCCMHCKYNLDDKAGKWIACSESCTHLIGYSCSNCNHSEYGKRKEE